MEKVRPWCGQPSDRGRLKNRTEQDHAKRSFYRAVNGIFGRIGRMASEEVILELIKTKCLPILLYGLEVCPLSKTKLAMSPL